MHLNAVQQKLLAELTAQTDGQQRLAWLVGRAATGTALPDELKTDPHRVAGCLSRLWLVVEWSGGRSRLRCASDSRLVNALARFICELFDGCTPAEILAGDLGALHAAGLASQLTPNRRNALSRVWEHLLVAAKAEQSRPASAGKPPEEHG